MPITPYVLQPEWEWPITIALFIAGVAAGTYSVMGLMHFAGDARDRVVADRLGLIPFPLMLIVPILLIIDLGQPERFLNLIFRSPGAVERGPSPFMLNTNSPMSSGGYVITIFAGFALIAFLDSLRRTRGWNVPLVGMLEGNKVWLAIGELLAITTSAYSGVLINVTNQGVWGDTFLMGALFVAFSELSGMAVAAIVAGRAKALETALAVRTGLFWFAAISAVLLVLFLAGLAAANDGSLAALTLSMLVGPAFWIGAVGLAILVPLVVVGRPRMMPGPERLTLIGALVLVGVLAFRYAMFFSAIAYAAS
ncbi:MAG: polysulfide reductase NrfD [Chloroflexi bacterium]|nr:polysulfide reductase NrfD [Chloroflexota bacterium]